MKKTAFAIGSLARVKSGHFKGKIVRVVAPHPALPHRIRAELADFPDYEGCFRPAELAPVKRAG